MVSLAQFHILGCGGKLHRRGKGCKGLVNMWLPRAIFYRRTFPHKTKLSLAPDFDGTLSEQVAAQVHTR